MIIAMLLLVYRSIITVLLTLVMVVFELFGRARNGRFPGLLQDHRALDVRHQPVGHVGDRGRHGLRDLLDRPISGSPR